MEVIRTPSSTTAKSSKLGVNQLRTVSTGVLIHRVESRSMLTSPAIAAHPSRTAAAFRSDFSSPTSASKISVRQNDAITFNISFKANFPDTAYIQLKRSIRTTNAKAMTGVLIRSRRRDQNRNASDSVSRIKNTAIDLTVFDEHKHIAKKNNAALSVLFNQSSTVRAGDASLTAWAIFFTSFAEIPSRNSPLHH